MQHEWHINGITSILLAIDHEHIVRVIGVRGTRRRNQILLHGIIARKTGMPHGMVSGDFGCVAMDTGVVAMYTGLVVMATGLVVMATGVVAMATGVVAMATGMVAMYTGMVAIATRPRH